MSNIQVLSRDNYLVSCWNRCDQSSFEKSYSLRLATIDNWSIEQFFMIFKHPNEKNSPILDQIVTEFNSVNCHMFDITICHLFLLPNARWLLLEVRSIWLQRDLLSLANIYELLRQITILFIYCHRSNELRLFLFSVSFIKIFKFKCWNVPKFRI